MLIQEVASASMSMLLSAGLSGACPALSPVTFVNLITAFC